MNIDRMSKGGNRVVWGLRTRSEEGRAGRRTREET